MKRRVITLALWGLSVVSAQDAGTFIQHLRQADRYQVHGNVETRVYFPPSDNPRRRRDALPRVEFVPALLERNFQVRRVAVERVAGRSAVRFDLTPKRGDANHWTVWMDAQWNVPLAMEERSANGEVVRRAAFTRVQGPPRRRLHRSPERASDPEFRRAVQEALPGLHLPEAFEAVGYRLSELGSELQFSDGVNVLALVVTPRAVRDGPGIASRRVGSQYVWLVGNLPDAQLHAALSGVRTVNLASLEGFAPDREERP